MSKQVYDTDGTTDFAYIYYEYVSKKNKDEWKIEFTQGCINIMNVYNTTRIKINYPIEDHWMYQEIVKTYVNNAFEQGGMIKNNHFILQVEVREYMDPNNHEFDPKYHEIGDNEGYIMMESKTINVELSIPYKLALSIMKFMSGSTDVKDPPRIWQIIKKQN